MSILMHIDPNDEAIAKTQNNLFFLFTDKSKRFSLEQCECIATTFESGHKISESKISSSYVPIIFPKKAVYIIEVAGKPIEGKSFEPFKITYDIRVEKEAESPISLFSKKYQIPIVLSIIIFLLGVTLVKTRKFNK
ncbi:MAG: hypothetical protein WAX44_03915 [Minisyncoccia bacterium]